MSATGREAVASNAAENGLTDRIVIHGVADDMLLEVLKNDNFDPARAIVLCDIEGGEFSVLNDAIIDYFAGATFVVELHPFAVPDGDAKEAALAQRLSLHHDLEIVKATPCDWSGIAEVEVLHDLERALVTSEGRKRLGRWLIATP